MWKPTVDEIERLYERHAKQLEATHWGKFLALASDGRFIVGDDDLEIFLKAMQHFGEGNFVLIRIGEKSVDVLRQVSQSVRSNIYPFLEVAWSVRHFRQQDWAYAETGFEGFLNIPSTFLKGSETLRVLFGKEWLMAQSHFYGLLWGSRNSWHR